MTWNEHLFCWVIAGTKYWLYLSWVCFLWELHYTFWRNKRVFCDKDLMFLNLSWGKVFHLQKYLPEIFSALQNIFSEISFAKCVFFCERSERGVCWRWDSTNNLSCESVDFILVRVWVSLYQNSACKTYKWGTTEWRDAKKKTLLWIWSIVKIPDKCHLYNM